MHKKNNIKFNEALGINLPSAIITLFLSLIIIILPNITSYAATNKNDNDNSDEYNYLGRYVKEYAITIDVNEDNTYHVQNEIVIHYDGDEHYDNVIMEIPTKIDTIDRKNIINAKVSNFKFIGNVTCTFINDEMKEITFFNEDNSTGDIKYSVDYDYELNNVPYKYRDILYFQIVNPSFNVDVTNINWQINMPNNFDPDPSNILYYSITDYGTGILLDDDYFLKSSYADNTIKGSYNSNIDLDTGLLISCKLDNGYFKINNYVIFFWVLIIGLLIVAAILFKFTGKDKDPIKVVSFEPPDNLNPLDVAFIYKNKRITIDDCMHLITYLISLGYIKTKQVKRTVNAKIIDDVQLTRNKGYDGNDFIVEKFLKELFTSKKAYISSVLESKYFFINILYNEYKNPIFKDLFKNNIFANIYYIVCCFISYYSLFIISNFPIIKSNLVFVFLGVFYLFFFGFRLQKYNNKITKIIFIILDIYWLFKTSVDAPIFILAFVLTFIYTQFSYYGEKRTEKGDKVLGQILGFRDYMEKVDLDKIDHYSKNDPNYFAKIISYACCLGLTDKWMNYNILSKSETCKEMNDVFNLYNNLKDKNKNNNRNNNGENTKRSENE